MTQTSIIVLAVCGMITGCLWAVCWATVQLARINADKPRENN